MSSNLAQSLMQAETMFAMFIYVISLLIALPIFEIIHEKLDHNSLQYFWDKIGMPVLRTFLLLLFIYLVYPINFGITEAPPFKDIVLTDRSRFDLLFNILFLVTFIYPLIPIIGKADAMMIPLQGIVASMLLFSWLHKQYNLQDYSLFPSAGVLVVIVIIALAGYILARFIAANLGAWLDKQFHREGYEILVFQAVVMIMQSPIIFIYGHALGKQLLSGNYV